MSFRSEEEDWVGLRDDFCRMDLIALRSQRVSVCIPPPGFERINGLWALLLRRCLVVLSCWEWNHAA